LGHVTDANATYSTKTLTLANLGYTGDSDANNYSLPVASTTLGGIKSGTDITVDSSGNVSVNNDSHTHDTRYYTETESDNRFVNTTGDTMTGDLSMGTNSTIYNNFRIEFNSTTNSLEFNYVE
jgi:hypothetical protein